MRDRADGADDLAAPASPSDRAWAALRDGLALADRGVPREAAEVLARALGDLDAAPVSGDTELVRARLLLALAMPQFEIDGDGDACDTRLADTLDLARGIDAASVVVAVHGQRALHALRTGNSDAALAHFDAAIELIDDSEPRDACILLLNRGSLHLDRGDLVAARADLGACVARAEAMGDAMLLFKSSHNLGYAEFLAGDLPQALAAMERAAQTHLPDVGLDLSALPIALLDRAQVLFEAGLVGEADERLARAGSLFEERGLEQDLAEVEVLRARCALLSGRAADAAELAASARRRFGDRGNAVWSARAHLTELQARLGALTGVEEPPRDELVELATEAEALLAASERDESGRVTADLGTRVRLVAAEARAVAGDRAAAATLLEGAAAARHDGPVESRVHGAVVEALLEFDRGDRAAGQAVVRAAQEVLGEFRAQFGSVEAVTASAIHGRRLAEVDLAAACRTGEAGEVLEAVDRGRSVFAGPARVRPRDASGPLAALSAELRRVSEQLRAVEPTAAVGRLAELREQADALRDQVRELSWQEAGGGRAPRPFTAAEVRERLGDAPDVTLAQFVVVRGRLLAAVLSAGMERLVDLGDATRWEESARRLRSDLRMVSNALVPRPLRDVARASLAREAAHLDAGLIAPLGEVGTLRVVGPAWLVTLPWSVLPSRRGRATPCGPGIFLGMRPGGVPRSAPRTTAVAGPAVPLAAQEVAAVVAGYPGAAALTGDAATCAATAHALRSADVVHLAAHGKHVADNPLFSSVLLADGPLFAYELDGEPLSAGLVVLSACEVGGATAVPGGQSLGLAAVLLRLGVRHVVAAVEPVSDEHAGAVMPRLHELVRAGFDPAGALAVVTADAGDASPFVCLTSDVA